MSATGASVAGARAASTSSPQTRVLTTPARPLWLTWTLMAACLLPFLFHLRVGWHALWHAADPLSVQLYLWPFASPRFRPWQLLTYALEHGSLPHLLVNLLGLGLFASSLERATGWRRTLSVFLVSVILAGVAQQSLSPWLGRSVPIVGASGGIFGLLVAFARAFPKTEMLLLPLPFVLRARTVAWLYGAIELCMAVPTSLPALVWLNHWFGDSAHFAHLGGMLGGCFLKVAVPRLPADAPPSEAP